VVVNDADAPLLLDVRADLGEGPMWHAERGLVTWVEIFDGRVNSLDLTGTPGPSYTIGRRVGAAVPAAGGALLLATDDGFALLDEAGDCRPISAVEADRPDTFMNDGKCDPRGRFWAGTVGVDPDTGLASKEGGTLYRLDPDGVVHPMLAGISLSNGMDWSPDGRTFYYIDSRSGHVDAHPYDTHTGEIGPGRPLVEIEPELGLADGMCVDADGCLWIALWGAGEVRRYSPGGALDLLVDLPLSQATSCAFAGPMLDTLVITSARRGISETDLEDQPHAGSIFCIRTGHSGLQPHLWTGTPADGR
jgi:sugar lactone lactonase YvrE